MKINVFSLAAPSIFKDVKKSAGEEAKTVKVTAHRPDNLFSLSYINEAGEEFLLNSGKLDAPDNKKFIEAVEAQLRIKARGLENIVACFISITRKDKIYTTTVDLYYTDREGNKLNNIFTY